jgi:uncharacterized protein YkwD
VTRPLTRTATTVAILACAASGATAAAASSGSVARARTPLAATSARTRPGTRTHAHGARPRKGAHGCVPAPARPHGHAPGATTCNSAKPHKAKTRTLTPRKASVTRESNAGAAEAASQAVTIAKVLSTPCENTQLVPEADNLGLVRAAVLCLVNTERAQNDKVPLAANSQLEQAAESHGREMISANYFDHISPSGETPVQRIQATGYVPSSEVGYVLGENLAWGTYSLATPQAIVSAWIASPEHLANILEGKYRETGIDVRPEEPQELAEGAPGALYTQEFGVIVH